MEIEGIREKALLTDEEIDRVLRDSPFAISHELITEILPDIKRVAQAQIDKFLKTDGIRIECSNQDLPDDPYGWASSQQKMLTPDSEGNVWVKCCKKDKE